VASIDDVIASLTTVRESLTRASAEASVAAELTRELREQLTAMGAYGVADRFTPVLTTIGEAIARLAAGIAVTEEAIARAVAAKGVAYSGGLGDHSRGNQPAPGGHDESQGRRVDREDHRDGRSGKIVPGGGTSRPPATPSAAPFHPGFMERLPVRRTDTDPTDGILATPEGTEISPVASGKTGPGQGGPGLRGRWRYEVAAVDHAEGHAAAIMRTRGIMDATLYSNKPAVRLPARMRPPPPRAASGGCPAYRVRAGTGQTQGLHRYRTRGTAMTDTINVYYQRGQEPAQVSTVAELDELLDRLHFDPVLRDAPPLVELVTPDETRALDVGLARPDYSVLLWHDDDADEVLASKGTIGTNTDAAFNFGGTWTHIPDRSAIPIELARQAAREFLTTGRRPTCVEWKLPAYSA